MKQFLVTLSIFCLFLTSVELQGVYAENEYEYTHDFDEVAGVCQPPCKANVPSRRLQTKEAF
jgi:hypothetical protein